MTKVKAKKVNAKLTEKVKLVGKLMGKVRAKLTC